MSARFSTQAPDFQSQRRYVNSRWNDTTAEDNSQNNGRRNPAVCNNYSGNSDVHYLGNNSARGEPCGNRYDSGTSSNGGNTKGSYSKGYGGDNMITQEDTIFVSGMDPSITEQDIQSHFGSIGVIKKDKKTMKPKIWLYKHKDTGLSKGEATVTYDDVNAAKSAISWFDGQDFNGSTIKVSLAQRYNNWNKSGGNVKGGFNAKGKNMQGGSDRNMTRSFNHHTNVNREERNEPRSNNGQGSNSRNNSGMSQREGDWRCTQCTNTNFSWRNECNRCKASKPQHNASYDMHPSKQPGRQQNFSENRRSNPRGNNFVPKGGNKKDLGPIRSHADKGDHVRPY